MPTVKSLEDRLDGVDERFDGVDHQLGELTTKLAVVASGQERLQAVMDTLAGYQRELAISQVKLQTKLDDVIPNQAKIQAQLASIESSLAMHQAQMAITNARLESVIDDLKLTRSRLESTNLRLDSPETGLGVLGVKVSSTGSELAEVAKKLDSHRTDFAAFQGQVNATLGIARWIAATAAVTMISVIIAAFTVARSAGSLETTVQLQQKTLDEIKLELTGMRPKK